MKKHFVNDSKKKTKNEDIEIDDEFTNDEYDFSNDFFEFVWKKISSFR